MDLVRTKRETTLLDGAAFFILGKLTAGYQTHGLLQKLPDCLSGILDARCVTKNHHPLSLAGGVTTNVVNR
jgi:hypothetical protein